MAQMSTAPPPRQRKSNNGLKKYPSRDGARAGAPDCTAATAGVAMASPRVVSVMGVTRAWFGRATDITRNRSAGETADAPGDAIFAGAFTQTGHGPTLPAGNGAPNGRNKGGFPCAQHLTMQAIATRGS